MIEVHAAAWLLPVSSEPIPDGAVAVDDGEIVAAGPRSELAAAFPLAPLRDHGEAAILPGLVNAHTHLEYAAYAGFGDGLAFAPWLDLHIERKARLGDGQVLDSARLGALAALRSGQTTIADCSYGGHAVQAAREAGLRGIVHVEAFGVGDPAPVVERTFARIEALAREAGPLLEIGISPHAPYSVSPAVYTALAHAAAARGLPVATHVAESEAEIEAARDGSGPIVQAMARLGYRPPLLREHPLARLARDGALVPRTTAIHCVQVGPTEIALLAEHDVGVVHCPRSNALLGCGTAPLAELLAAGVRVGIGTDSPASALDMDAFEELRAAVLAARVRERRPDALTATAALALATLGSARVLGLDALVGSIEPGKRADLCVLDLTGSPWWPTDGPASAVVYGGSPDRVALTLVDGAVRYRKTRDARRYLDVVERAAVGRARMIEKVGTT